MMLFVIFTNQKSQKIKSVDWALMVFLIFSLQLVLGFILYFISTVVSFESGFMKIAKFRFFTIEHILGMIIAYHFVMIAFLKQRKSMYMADNKKLRIYYGIALLIILLSIPWPFRGFGNGWF
jgi:hypothetical protein